MALGDCELTFFIMSHVVCPNTIFMFMFMVIAVYQENPSPDSKATLLQLQVLSYRNYINKYSDGRYYFCLQYPFSAFLETLKIFV